MHRKKPTNKIQQLPNLRMLGKGNPQKENTMTTKPLFPIMLAGLVAIGCTQSENEEGTQDNSPTTEDDNQQETENGFEDEKQGEGKEDYEEGEEGSEECNNAADSNFRTIVRGSETREFILHIPSSYDSSTPTPLIINFHGFGGCATDFADTIGNYYNLNNLADSENIIVAYPQGITRAKGAPEWDPADPSSTQSITENDVLFTRELVAEVSSELNVDSDRVYATGYSNGGMMVYGLACNAADLIAAGGIMSGIMLGTACEGDEFISLIHFHGIGDDALPYDGSGDFISVEQTVDIMLSHNNIPSDSLVTTQRNGGNVVHDVYSGGSEGTSFELYTVHSEHGKEGGHVWFSEEIDGDSPNQILWDFLSTYNLND